jgi:hypothetical protein
MTFAALLLLHPVIAAGGMLLQPKDREPIKPALEYIRTHWQAGDYLYVYQGGITPFMFYKGRYGFEDSNSVIGTRFFKEDPAVLEPDIRALEGRKRVWCLLSHIMLFDGTDKRPAFLEYMKNKGQLLDTFDVLDVSAYLYEFKS